MRLERGDLLLVTGQWRAITVTMKLGRRRQSAGKTEEQAEHGVHACARPSVEPGGEHSKANLPCVRCRSALAQKRRAAD